MDTTAMTTPHGHSADPITLIYTMPPNTSSQPTTPPHRRQSGGHLISMIPSVRSAHCSVDFPR